MAEKKRKAKRVYEDDPEGEMALPVKSTKELAEQHKKSLSNERWSHKPALNDVGKNEKGKELFDDILKAMASPDNRKS